MFNANNALEKAAVAANTQAGLKLVDVDLCIKKYLKAVALILKFIADLHLVLESIELQKIVLALPISGPYLTEMCRS